MVAAEHNDEMRVAFPASARFAPVGRVAMAGLALRLGFDVGQVENLRLAVSAAIAALGGPGDVTLTARWTDTTLQIELENPDAAGIASDTGDAVDAAALSRQLAELVASVSVATTHVSLELASP